MLMHHCAMGNQPRVKATYAMRSVEGGTAFDFTFDRVFNLREEHDGYMGGDDARRSVEDGELRQDWKHFDQSGAEGDGASFLLRRK